MWLKRDKDTKPDWGDVAFALEIARRAIRRAISRSSLLRRMLGFPADAPARHEPGLLLVQIDGLSRRQAQRALAEGKMPFLRSLLDRENYHLHEFYSGLPSSTPGVQGELYYNVRCAVPSFAFLDRRRKQFAIMHDAKVAQQVEAELQQRGETPLLQGGSSWSNVFGGGAKPEECHFCSVSLRASEMLGRTSLIALILIGLFHLPALLRVTFLATVEFLAGAWSAVKAIAKGGDALCAAKTVVARVFICTILRELIEIGAGIDLVRGLPIVHVNFLSYDERAHRDGPASADAFSELPRIDRAIRRLFQKARRSQTTDYDVWIISDHGHEQVQSVAKEVDGGIGQIVHEGLKQVELSGSGSYRVFDEDESRVSWLASHRLRRRLEKQEIPGVEDAAAQAFAVVARGPIGHLYLTNAITLEEKRRLAKWLVEKGRVPGVAFRSAPGEAVWVHPKGEARLPDEGGELLSCSQPVRGELLRDFVALCEHQNSGDLLLLGWNPEGQPRSFPIEQGGHGGPGADETHGFALLPFNTRLPEQANQYIRPSALREAILHALGRRRIVRFRRARPREAQTLRVLSYNVHSCVGLDGRHSPGRIARIIRGFDPDVVALQEIDVSRPRSAGEDQTRLLAEALEMETAFCCTVERASERYGHMILSRFPMEVIASGRFAAAGGKQEREARGALIARIRVAEEEIYVANTHLGLTPAERLAQARELAGDQWLGGLPDRARVILCGDLNARPGSPPYSLLAAKFRDAASSAPTPAPAATFVSPLPFARIDYVFVSTHFQVESVRVPRNSLTTVASDHLPLVVDLKLVSTAPAGSVSVRGRSVAANANTAHDCRS